MRESRRDLAKRADVNPRTPRRDQYICSAVIEVPKGAPLPVSWPAAGSGQRRQPEPDGDAPGAGREAGRLEQSGRADRDRVRARIRQGNTGRASACRATPQAAARTNPLNPIAQERRIDQVSQPQVRTAVPTPSASPATPVSQPEIRAATPSTAANPAIQVSQPEVRATTPSPATKFQPRRRRRARRPRRPAASRLQAPQRTVVAPDSTFSR